MKINDVLLTESTDQLDEIFNPTGLFAGIVRWAVDNPVIIAGLGVAGAGAAVGLTGGAAALGPLISAATGASLGQGAVGLLTLDKLKDIIQSNPNQAENWFKKQIYKYIGDEADAKEFSLLHAKTAYLGKEQMFRWRAKEWPVTMKRDEAEAFLEKTEKFWLDSEKQKAIDAEKANTDAMPPNQDGTNKVAEGLTRGVDAKGRTQEKWLALVKAKFPPGSPVTVTKLIQAKMIDGPIIAYLSNGKQIGWKKVEQAVAEGKDNPYGYHKGQTVKLNNGQQGRVIDIFDDSIEVLLVSGRTVTVDFRDAQVISEQDLDEGNKRSEADYGPDYQDMVSRVKKLAGLGPLKTVYDPQKRVYKNVPVAQQPAQQPKKER